MPHTPSRTLTLLATGILVLVTFFWGSTFLVVKNVTAQMPVLAFLGERFALAALVMLAIRPRAILRLSAKDRRRGILVGLVLAGGYITQTVGLQTTPSSVSGFITGMFLVFTPLVAWLVLRRPLGLATWLGVALATAGLALISLHGMGLSVGIVLTLACAMFFAIQLLQLEAWATRENAYGLATLQLAVVGGVCLLGAPLYGGLEWPSSGGQWGALVFCALGATAFAFLAQTWAQSILTATRCAVIMTMEPVFAGLIGVLVADDELTVRLVIGAVCIVGAMLVIELGSRHGKDAIVPALEH